MCEYCINGDEWVVYAQNKTFGKLVCTDHLSEAIKKEHALRKSTDIIHVEPINL